MDTIRQGFISDIRRFSPTKACQTIIDLAPEFTYSITPKEGIEIHHPIFEGGAWLEDVIEFYDSGRISCLTIEILFTMSGSSTWVILYTIFTGRLTRSRRRDAELRSIPTARS